MQIVVFRQTGNTLPDAVLLVQEKLHNLLKCRLRCLEQGELGIDGLSQRSPHTLFNEIQ